MTDEEPSFTFLALKAALLSRQQLGDLYDQSTETLREAIRSATETRSQADVARELGWSRQRLHEFMKEGKK